MSLTVLALAASDTWYKTSGVPAPCKWTSAMSAGARPLSDEEKERLKQMNEDARFSTTAALGNFDARLGLYLPPTGYAAVWNAKAMFNAHVFDQNLFRGLAGITIKRARPPGDIKKSFAFPVNALVGDCSPLPETQNPPDPEGPWVCSLGPFAWMGLYMSTDASKTGMSALVVAGLDSASWQALRNEMLTNWHRKITVAEAHAKLAPWRALAAANRRRLLAALLRVTGEEPESGSAWIELPQSVYPSSRAQSFVPDLSHWLDPKVRVPNWFVFPSKLPRDCPPNHGCELGQGVARSDWRETYVFEIKPEFDICMDDLRDHRENEFVRLAAACSAREEFTARVYGPLDSVLVSRQEPGFKAESHDAVAAQAAQFTSGSYVAHRSETESEEVATWEDLNENRLLKSAFHFRSSDEPMDRNLVRYRPYCVRVSCRDSTGRAEPESVTKTRRLAGLALDDYDPIRR